MAKRKPAAEQPPIPAEVAPPKNSRLVLAAVILIFIVLAAAYNLVTPADPRNQHNPDENGHLLYVQRLAAGHLPVFGRAADGPEAHQPPLYYALCVPAYLLVRHNGISAETHALRWVSTALGILLILATYACARRVLPGYPAAAIAAAGFVALLPMNVDLSACVTNDPLTNLLIAASLAVLAGVVRDSPAAQARSAVSLGLLMGLGIWTKSSTLLLLPVAAFAYYLAARKGLIEARPALRLGATAIGLAILVGLPWLIRNQVLYGDPFAQRIFQQSFQDTAHAGDIARGVFGGSISAYLGTVAVWTFASFWGVFDSMTLFWGQDPHAPVWPLTAGLPPIYWLLAGIVIASMAGLVLLLRSKTSQITDRARAVLSCFSVLIALTWLAHLRFVLVFFQAQGRYWFPSLVPLAIFFVLGWRGWVKSETAAVVVYALLGFGMLALNVYTIFGLLIPRFAG